MSDPEGRSDHYETIARAIRFLDENRAHQPGLEALSDHVGLSGPHLQRVFSEWAGVSPKQYLQFLTKEYAKQKLRESPVLEAAWSAGLSGSGRLHDLMVTCEGVTPGEYRSFGRDLTIHSGIHDSPFGRCLLARTDRGICKLAFFDTPEEQRGLEAELAREWSLARIVRDDARSRELVDRIFGSGRRLERRPLHLLLRGSPFRLRIWQALLEIPPGELVAYHQVAERAGAPRATRAVASAIARNEIAYLIPCHRVIRGDGEAGGYRWGRERKAALIAWEASR